MARYRFRTTYNNHNEMGPDTIIIEANQIEALHIIEVLAKQIAKWGSSDLYIHGILKEQEQTDEP